MFNPEKILGSMLKSGMRGKGIGSLLSGDLLRSGGHTKGIGSLVSGGAALGLLGVAMEAVEHYMNRPQAATQSPSSGPPPAPGSAMQGGPPPSPGTSGRIPPPPPSSPPPGSTQDAGGRDAVLLIRAMIAAANADGVIDADERAKIMDKLKTVELSNEEHQFIVHELLAPQTLDSIVNAVKEPEMARQVYAASLLAISVDTDAERQYLSDLAQKLELDPQSVERIHQQFGQNE